MSEVWCDPDVDGLTPMRTTHREVSCNRPTEIIFEKKVKYLKVIFANTANEYRKRFGLKSKQLKFAYL